MMERCDVLVVGAGPAGSTCARMLTRAGLDVVVLEKATFPRDKVCAGWITPDVFASLDIDPAAYGEGRTLEPIHAFRVGTIGRHGGVEVRYPDAVGFGIRRSEFDDYLLGRSGARVVMGEAVTDIRRDAGRWVVNGSFTAPMLVGAAGHFCPVARAIRPPGRRAPVVTAQEVELPLDVAEGPARRLDAPEIYFCPDLRGYGWVFRKGQYLNVGLGRFGGAGLPAAVARFAQFLHASGRIAVDASGWRWRGHAYAVAGDGFESAYADGVVLAGDAAAVAYPFSGEGIRPAIDSGTLAAEAILNATGGYARERLAPYATALQRRFGSSIAARALRRMVPADLAARLGQRLLYKRWFVRHVVVDGWFLRAA